MTKLLSIIFSIGFLLGIEGAAYCDESQIFRNNLQPNQWYSYDSKVKSKFGTFTYEIHYRGEDEFYARRVNHILLSYTNEVFDYFEYVPRSRVHFNIREATTANGNARVFPTTIINLFNFPPSGNSHLQSIDDWIKGLVIHELIHIVHMEQTDGVISGLESLFGSVGRLGGVVPTWFVEGIAVWGETHFSEGGRLASRDVLFELYGRLLSENFCESIDCLDGPQTYPHGQLAYWMGALFLNHLEEGRPGVIRCLIKENSRNFPFFLNYAFKKCHLDSASSLFKRFRADLIDELKELRSELRVELGEYESWIDHYDLPSEDVHGRSDKNIDGVAVWQAGDLVSHSQFIFPVSRLRDSFLKTVNLKTKQESELSLSSRLVRLSEQSNFSKERDEFLLALRGLDIRGQARLWHRGQLSGDEEKKLSIEKRLTFLDQALDAFEIQRDHYLAFFFRDSRWQVDEIKVTKDGVITSQKTLYSWKRLDQISDIRVIKDPKDKRLKILHKAYLQLEKKEGQSSHPYQFYELLLERTSDGSYKLDDKRRIHFSSTAFDFHGFCQGHYLFSDQEDSLRAIFVRPYDQEGTSSLLERFSFDLEWRYPIADLKIGDDLTTIRFVNDPTRIYFSTYACEEIVEEFTFEMPSREIYSSQREDSKSPQSLEGSKVDSFPHLGHFRPYYWLIDYTRQTSLDRLQVSTTLSDPLLKNNFDLRLDHYKSDLDSDLGAALVYRYSWYEHHIRFGFVRSFFSSSFSETGLEREQMAYSSYSRIFYLGQNHIITPEINLSYAKERDFISNRTTQRARLGATYQRISQREHNFFQNTYLRFRLSHVDSKNRESFLSQTFNFRQSFRFSRNFSFFMRGAYAKLFSEELTSGLLYGGGYETIGEQIDFPFYGLMYSDLFGRELATLRLQGSYNLLRPYSAGGGLLPFYLKEVDLIGGLDFSYAEFSYLASRKTFLRNEILHSMHVGLRFDMTLFYHMPTMIDFLYARLSDPDSSSPASEEFIFSLSTPIF